MKKKRYPSQVKYDENNPTVTVRVAGELKDRLDVIRRCTGRSYPELVLDGLKKSAKLGEDVRNAAIEDYGIFHTCSLCEELFPVSDEDTRVELMVCLDEIWEGVYVVCEFCGRNVVSDEDLEKLEGIRG